MISQEQNEMMCRVGRGTVMGDFLREFWTPACLSSELKADGDPMRLMLFGEKLIAFRDTHGRVGVFDHRCPHRCASLFFGRNEEGGIRCVYHGWKFDVDGKCLDQPNLTDKTKYPAGTPAIAYKVIERAGLVFVYMGKREAPPFPEIEAIFGEHREGTIALSHRECNWMQALEGDVDTSHLGFLHVGGIDGHAIEETNPNRYTIINKAPEINVTETSYGTMYSASRDADPGLEHHRFACFIFPFWVTYPGGSQLKDSVTLNGWVPIDDTNTMIFNIDRLRGLPGGEVLRYKDGTPVEGLARPLDYLPTTSDWQGRWRAAANRSNDYGIDREWQRSGGSYSGIRGIPLQDQAIQEAMDPIVDRTMEHLASSDRMVMITRRRLLDAAVKYRETGRLPEVRDNPSLARVTAAGDVLAPKGTDWLDVYEKTMTDRYGPNSFKRDAAE
ncbi:Rieske 2Fe-2S domain-containing protein [Methylocella sp. CPCC 101449]|uniref:Rieske 2Fe-2S domain-containing protein n=1 Tax=Methylocella sp. CPCC 101449 TaxID=2987531 RepID=UPI002890B6D0|nr:Rieske 2Fe-2S domain-containing protein [Methylocella sp. CPCC 101449]MDT2022399.1 Rieske 2Fe-2S domain-containing protein [Methylocella sp. CPCC 101449]